MNPLKVTKAVLIGGWVLGLVLWASSGSMSKVAVTTGEKENTPPATAKDMDGGDYVGSDTPKPCHEDQFNNFAHTAHKKLEDLSSWKGKVVGCEACHGPGKAHVEAAD